MKFATNGARKWKKMDCTTGLDGSYGLAVDKVRSDLYLMGPVRAAIYGQAYSGSGDTFLMRYSLNGTRIWTRVETSGGGQDEGNKVTVDSATGDVYVPGHVSGGLHNQFLTGDRTLFC
ncbi:hypothetical protein EON65_18160 [archaeon]|nr:MAG: hypothetical protein EON65_18160 [archaeon]